MTVATKNAKGAKRVNHGTHTSTTSLKSLYLLVRREGGDVKVGELRVWSGGVES